MVKKPGYDTILYEYYFHLGPDISNQVANKENLCKSWLTIAKLDTYCYVMTTEGYQQTIDSQFDSNRVLNTPGIVLN